jgi:hypothetical protein
MNRKFKLGSMTGIVLAPEIVFSNGMIPIGIKVGFSIAATVGFVKRNHNDDINQIISRTL